MIKEIIVQIRLLRSLKGEIFLKVKSTGSELAQVRLYTDINEDIIFIFLCILPPCYRLTYFITYVLTNVLTYFTSTRRTMDLASCFKSLEMTLENRRRGLRYYGVKGA